MDLELFSDIRRAYHDARTNKRNTYNQLKFEFRLEENLHRLYEQLASRTYTPGRSVVFIVHEPVKREVFAAGFVDRVVHHLYFNYVNDFFERSFITDSYSCRKGKGTSYGVERLDHHMRSCSANYTRDAYVLKLDMSGYFMSIDRSILYEKVMKVLNRYADEVPNFDLVEYLTREIVFHDPVRNCFIKGHRDEWEGLPDDKSLFSSPKGCGLPIGNLTSQLYSNVYLNDFDHFVKRDLGVKHYGRYVDDFFLIHESKEFLMECRDRIRDYLIRELRIRLHPYKIYLQHVRRGAVFLGAVVKPHRVYMSNRTLTNFRRTLELGEGHFLDKKEHLTQMLNSYLGLTGQYKTFNWRNHLIDHHRWIFNHGWIDSSRLKFTLDEEGLAFEPAISPEWEALPEAIFETEFAPAG